MKISHELPIDLLLYSYKWNDFDYCLPKFLSIPKYKEYFIQARKDGRFIILDNGLFEGETYTDEYLLSLISELKPNIFIVPDEWNNSKKTYENAKRWKTYDVPTSTDLMVVIQAEDIANLAILYDNLNIELGYKHIAFNHSLDLYQELYPHKNKLVSQMMGRIFIINYLNISGIINPDIYHHLLGCSLPQELVYYKDYNFINSVDTSSPIINGTLGIRYEDYGLLTKPTLKLENILENNNIKNIENIIFNVKKFRKFCI